MLIALLRFKINRTAEVVWHPTVTPEELKFGLFVTGQSYYRKYGRWHGAHLFLERDWQKTRGLGTHRCKL